MARELKPRLIVMAGLPGSGKSTVAYALSKRMKFPVFSVDPIHSAILRAGVEDNFAAGYADYIVAEKLAEENLNNGVSVIVDASNYVEQSQMMWEKLAQRCGVDLRVIECKLESREHRKRIEERVRNIPGMKKVTWQDVEKRIAEAHEWKVAKLALDMGRDLDLNLRKAVRYVTE